MSLDIHAQPPAVGRSESPRGGATVLVVEDDRAFGDVLEVALRARGYTVLRARTVTSALAALGSAGHVELIVTDQRLPDELGYHLMFAEQVLRDHTPVLIMTAFPSDALRSFLHLRGVPLLEKPFRMKQLVADVLALVGPRASDPAAA